MRTGKIIQVSGSVVDVRFPQGGLPRIREALSVEVDGARRVMEVAQHLSSDTVRCIMLSGSEGLARGMDVTGEGSGKRQRDAEHAAAKDALSKLERHGEKNAH